MIWLEPYPALFDECVTGNRLRCTVTRPSPSIRSSALDPDDVGAQIDLIGVPWRMISFESSAAQSGGSSSMSGGSSVTIGDFGADSRPCERPRGQTWSPAGCDAAGGGHSSADGRATGHAGSGQLTIA